MSNSDNFTIMFDADAAKVEKVLSKWQEMCQADKKGEAIDSTEYFPDADEEQLVMHMRIRLQEAGINPSTVYPMEAKDFNAPGLMNVTFTYEFPQE